MKGSMFRALEEMVVGNYGRKFWENSLEHVAYPRTYRFAIQENVPDELWNKLLRGVAISVTKGVQAVQEEFSDYWIKTYTQKLYGAFYMGANTTREFIERLDFVHVGMTRDIKDATPPRFNYDWKSSQELIITYQSSRNMIDLMIDYLKSLDEKMGCQTVVKQLSDNRLQLIFDK